MPPSTRTPRRYHGRILRYIGPLFGGKGIFALVRGSMGKPGDRASLLCGRPMSSTLSSCMVRDGTCERRRLGCQSARPPVVPVHEERSNVSVQIPHRTVESVQFTPRGGGEIIFDLALTAYVHTLSPPHPH
jgi:hypothetical protein